MQLSYLSFIELLWFNRAEATEPKKQFETSRYGDSCALKYADSTTNNAGK